MFFKVFFVSCNLIGPFCMHMATPFFIATLVENYCSVLNIIISLSFCLGFSIKIWEIIEIEREKRQEIDHQRRPQNSRWRRSCDQNHGLSKMKIDDVSVKFGYNPGHTDSVKEGTIFMGLLVLFGVFNQVLKCLGP